MARVGTLVVACPDCDAHIEVPVSVFLDLDEYGRQEWWTKVEDHDLWAHAWTHDEYLMVEGDCGE